MIPSFCLVDMEACGEIPDSANEFQDQGIGNEGGFAVAMFWPAGCTNAWNNRTAGCKPRPNGRMMRRKSRFVIGSCGTTSPTQAADFCVC